jgi:hypothetical protein
VNLLLTSTSLFRHLCRIVLVFHTLERYSFFRRFTVSLYERCVHRLPAFVISLLSKFYFFTQRRSDVFLHNVDLHLMSAWRSVASIRYFKTTYRMFTDVFSDGVDRLFGFAWFDYVNLSPNQVQTYDIALPQALNELTDIQLGHPGFFDPSDGFLSGAGFFNMPTSDKLTDDISINLTPVRSRRAFFHYWLSRYLSACFWSMQLYVAPSSFVLNYLFSSWTIRNVAIALVTQPGNFVDSPLGVVFYSTVLFPVPAFLVKTLLS